MTFCPGVVPMNSCVLSRNRLSLCPFRISTPPAPPAASNLTIFSSTFEQHTRYLGEAPFEGRHSYFEQNPKFNTVSIAPPKGELQLRSISEHFLPVSKPSRTTVGCQSRRSRKVLFSKRKSPDFRSDRPSETPRLRSRRARNCALSMIITRLTIAACETRRRRHGASRPSRLPAGRDIELMLPVLTLS